MMQSRELRASIGIKPGSFIWKDEKYKVRKVNPLSLCYREGRMFQTSHHLNEAQKMNA